VLAGIVAGILAAPVAASAQRAPAAASAAGDRWWQEGVVYQIYPRSFQDSDGDGVGDLRGITQRLDYLRWLGVNALWISPFFPSPMRDFGYDVADYTGVDSTFGTMADFEALVREAHARGLRVILDFVENHSSDQHPWFRASRASRASPRRDWYVWRDPAPGRRAADQLALGVRRQRVDARPDHRAVLLPPVPQEQPDLNWRNPDVRRAMYDAMRFWLDRGVDGFRLDAYPHLVESERLVDNPPDTTWRPGRGEYDRLVAVHTTHQPEALDVLCEMRRVADGYARRDGQGRVLIGEIYTTPERLMTYYGRGGCGAQLPSNFALLGAPWNAATVHERITAYVRALPPGRWPNWVMGNHDNSRLATRLGPEAARAAAVLLLTLHGTPTIYYGDELGMRDVPIPPELVQDPSEKNQPGLGLGRDPERTPMQWSAAPGAGFTTGRPWLPSPPTRAERHVEAARADSASTLTLYRRLLALRRAEPALSRGRFRLLPRQGEVLAYVREDARRGGRRFLVLVNLAATPSAFALAAAGADAASLRGAAARVAAGTHPRGDAAVALDRVALAGSEAVVLRLGAATDAATNAATDASTGASTGAPPGARPRVTKTP
jgi:alpha-glucosidase